MPKLRFVTFGYKTALILCAMLLLALTLAQTQPATQSTTRPALKIACVGASITAGFGTTDRAHDNYPAQLQKILGPTYEIHNFGVSGRTMLKKADRPYWDTKQFTQAHDLHPDIVIIDLGGNDSKPENWTPHKADFEPDTRAMIASFQKLSSHPRILLLLPFPFRPHDSMVSDDFIIKEQIPIFQKIAADTHIELVDMHTPFVDKKDWFADGIHPNNEGAALAAKILAEAIAPEHNPETQPAK